MDWKFGLEIKRRELVIYQTQAGLAPFEDWLDKLQDIKGRAIIRKRLNRVRLGNIGVTNSVGSGVFELKINYGPGYRIYFGEQGDAIIVLLCGGDKATQKKDIQKAQGYWADFLS